MRSLLIEVTKGYDVLLKSCTIAGVAMKIFRRLYLQPNQLAIVPEFGYERVDNASDKAVKYLEWIEKRDKVKLQHAGNGREKKFLMMDPMNGKTWTVKVDGYEEKTDHVIEILGW
jgi:hypothetical protein